MYNTCVHVHVYPRPIVQCGDFCSHSEHTCNYTCTCMSSKLKLKTLIIKVHVSHRMPISYM